MQAYTYSMDLASPANSRSAPVIGHPTTSPSVNTYISEFDLAQEVAAVDAELQALLQHVRLDKALQRRALGQNTVADAHPLSSSRIEPADTVFFRNPFTPRHEPVAPPCTSYVAPHQPSPIPVQIDTTPESQWDTADGLIQPELIELVRVGALDLAVVVPEASSALSSAGWRQLGALCMDLAIAEQNDSSRARILAQASRAYAFASGATVNFDTWPLTQPASSQNTASSSPPRTDLNEDVPAPHLVSCWSPESYLFDDGHFENPRPAPKPAAITRMPTLAVTPVGHNRPFFDSNLTQPRPERHDEVGSQIVEWLERSLSESRGPSPIRHVYGEDLGTRLG
ncbi:hypothetical protein EXIGLDRAFT_751200 [Exidia glandulosa HHB12029]|uniref:Uncharacterized protein n=1 Tax=Exidia glandulosa HHB12029 TaxID=1314781 RepID=A0A165FQN5_EXIGL|nr:hypothetical protein EXIGLDRAFT_751200 [Exidia glandulosa HHB12029]